MNEQVIRWFASMPNLEMVQILFFLASQDALEVMLFTDSLTHLLMVSIDLTDVTFVSDDTERGLDWCDSVEQRCHLET